MSVFDFRRLALSNGDVCYRACQAEKIVITYKQFSFRGSVVSLNTYSSRDFTRDVSAAKRAAERSPVIITDRGKPAYALLNIRDYYQLCGEHEATLLTCMDAITGTEGLLFDPAPVVVRTHGVDLG